MNLYKVVVKVDGKYVSAMTRHIGEHVVTYRVGKWSKPHLKGSKLFCFKSLRVARQFIEDMKFHDLDPDNSFVFKCEGKNLVVGGQFSGWLSERAIRYFWTKEGSPVEMINGSSKQTVFADEIKITKKVWP